MGFLRQQKKLIIKTISASSLCKNGFDELQKHKKSCQKMIQDFQIKTNSTEDISEISRWQSAKSDISP
jgi:hypothetical protein